MGMMLIFFSVTYAMPIVTSIIYDDGALFEFVDALAFCLLVGIGLWWPTRHFKRELQPRDGFLLVTLAWIMMAGILHRRLFRDHVRADHHRGHRACRS